MWFSKNKSQDKSAPNYPKGGQGSSDFILGAIEDGVVMVRQDGLVQLFNPAAVTITGWPVDEAMGTNYYSVLSLVDDKGQPIPQEQHPFAQALIGGKTVRDSNCQLAARSGKSLAVSMIVSPIMDASGQPSGNVVGVIRDVTKEKEQEKQRSDFISTASHEMRTPIAAIEGYLSLALNPKIAHVDENAKKYIDKASTATKHLGVLFQDLLTSSRAEDGRLASYPAVVEIGETVAQIVDAERFHAKEKNLTLNYSVSAQGDTTEGKVIRPLYYTFVDPHRIAEVLQNVLDNAIKYTMQGSITVRLTGDTKIVQIQVNDTGSGIPAEDIPHLFQKFYRVDSTATRTVGGTGLGLFISKRIIELYNGRIWVESTVGKGSTFYINLPRLNSTQALEMQRKQAATISPVQAGK